MKLKKIISFTGRIVLLTGLHIGGNNNQMKIGGLDNEVVKHPVTQEPYIPGSSIKGKMRSQLEKAYGKVRDDGKPCRCGQLDCPVCVLFGAHMNPNAISAPTRIIVRDGYLTDDIRKKYADILLDKGTAYLEAKAENTVNRKTGTADNPRFTERVPEGTEFILNIQLQVFDGDDENFFKNAVKKGLELVEQTYLGGSGSRGYGQVKFYYEITELNY